jgi:anti-anti-sigma regulatory factor
LKLIGEFDGSSACELMNLLSNSDLSSASKILVDTDSLNHIHPFGVDVLQHLLSAATARNFPLIFTGKMSTRFSLK